MRRIAYTFLLLTLVRFQPLTAQVSLTNLLRGQQYAAPISALEARPNAGNQPVTYALTSRHFTWDKFGQRWFHDQTLSRGFDPQGRLTGEEVRLSNDSLSHRYLYAYDSQGNLNESLLQLWEEGQWTNYSQYEFQFNASGQLLQSTYSRWINDQKTMEKQSQYLFDAKGTMIEEVHRQRVEEVIVVHFHLRYQHIYSPTGDLLSSISLYESGSEWTEYKRSTFTWLLSGDLASHTRQSWLRVSGIYKWIDQEASDYTYDQHGHIAIILSRQFDLSQWNDIRKQEFTTLQFGGTQEVSYRMENEMWEPEYEKINRFDAQHIELENAYRTWIGFTWITLSSSLGHPEYGINSRLEQETRQIFDQVTQTHTNYEKWIHEDFFTFNPTTSTATPFESTDISVSPNPATSFLNVRLSEISTSLISMKIFDAHGNVVWSNASSGRPGPEIQIPIDELGSGIYFLHVKGQGNGVSKRFVKI